jgi:hypothetical protein
VVVSWAHRPAGSERRELRIPRGVVVVRYTNSKAKRVAPRIVLTAQKDGEAELIGLTSHSQQVLAKPGNAVVVRAQRDTTIVIEIVPAEDDGSLDAEIHVERLSSHLPQEDRIADRVAMPAPAVLATSLRDALDDFRILAHVARHGDVVVGSGEWICGPRVPMSVEGIEVQLGRLAEGIDVLVSAEARLRRPLSFPATSAGSFVGTRGRATPLTGLTFSLIGRAAASFQLSIDALFLGNPIVTKIGNSIELSGPSGTEPLVGIRLSLQEAAVARPAPARPAMPMAVAQRAPLEAAANSQIASNHVLAKQAMNGTTGRVRVFRAANAHSA